jgi:hypothetical protein
MLGRSFVNLDTGQIVPARCVRLRCSYCLRVNARRRAMAIAAARPERAILLTQVGNDWQTCRDRIKQCRYWLAQEVGPFEWVTHVEPNPAGTGHHVHAWQHSGNPRVGMGHGVNGAGSDERRTAFIPQALLSSVARRCGMGGFARINKLRSAKGAGTYGLKGISYGLKGVEADDEGLTYLVDNGWRLTHQSRGFFRDGNVPVGVKDAERLAMPSAVAGRWVLMVTPV